MSSQKQLTCTKCHKNSSISSNSNEEWYLQTKSDSYESDEPEVISVVVTNGSVFQRRTNRGLSWLGNLADIKGTNGHYWKDFDGTSVLIDYTTYCTKCTYFK